MRIISEHFRLAGKHEYIRKLQDELPPHFSVTATPHYIVAADSDSTEIYAAALEDIYLEVHAAMHRLGLNPTQPELPLTAVIFRGDADPDVHHRRRLGRPAPRLRGDQVLPVLLPGYRWLVIVVRAADCVYHRAGRYRRVELRVWELLLLMLLLLLLLRMLLLLLLPLLKIGCGLVFKGLDDCLGD